MIRLLTASLAVVLAVGLAILVSNSGGSAPAPADEPPLRTIHDRGISFRYPAGWTELPVGGSTSGFGETTHLLGTQPFPASCRTGGFADINCFYEQPLAPGAVLVEIGTASLSGQTIFDPVPIDPTHSVTASRGTVGGLPATFVDRGDMGPDDFYHSDLNLEWRIALPDAVDQVVTVTVRGRNPGSATLRDQAQALIASLQFDDAPTPLPTDAAGIAAARASAADFLRATGAQMLGALVPDAKPPTVEDCLADAVDAPVTRRVATGPGGSLGGTIDVRCTVTIAGEGGVFWRIDGTAGSGTDSIQPGRSWHATYWLTSAGLPAGSWAEGDLAPARIPVGATRAAAARAAMRRALRDLGSSNDFYVCFSVIPGAVSQGTIATSPDGTTHYHEVRGACRTEIEALPDRSGWNVVLTATWEAQNGLPAGRAVATIRLDPVGNVGEVVATGDPVP